MHILSFDISPVRVETADDGKEYVEVCEDSEATAWALYGRDERGFATHIKDYASRKAAETAKRRFEVERFFVSERVSGPDVVYQVVTFNYLCNPRGHAVTGILPAETARKFADALNLLVDVNDKLNKTQRMTDFDKPILGLHTKIRRYLASLYEEKEHRAEIRAWQKLVYNERELAVLDAKAAAEAKRPPARDSDFPNLKG